MLKQLLFDANKLEELAHMEGFEDSTEMILQFGYGDYIPAICMNEDCEATYNYEPDQDKGWCDECETNSVKSCLVLAGLC